METPLLQNIIGTILSPLVVGLVLWFVADNAEKRKVKSEAIRDLMTYRGDFGSTDFRRSLNKVAVVFHKREDIRSEIRHLYEVLNNPANNSQQTNRAIVGLIYKLCKVQGFNGLTEYDIDQAFSENKQAPNPSSDVFDTF